MRTPTLALFACCVIGCATEEPLYEAAEISTEDQPALEEEEREPTLRFTAPDDMHFLTPDDGEFTGNEYTSATCYVRLVYCRDPRFSGLPSYCHSGCSGHAVTKAYTLCRSVCGNISCNPLIDLHGC